MSECAGMCCAAFPISCDVDNYLWFRWPTVRDGATLLDMLLPLTHEQARDRLAAVGSPVEPNTDVEYFTCRHWDETTRLCGIYEDRPDMCRSYPNTPTGCEHGCSCVGAS